MKMKTPLALALIGLAGFSSAQLSTANGLFVDRVFTDFTTSNRSETINYPTSAIISDLNLTDDGIGGNFANRTDLVFSADGGTSKLLLDRTQNFSVFADVTMNLPAGTPNTPRKEAGFRINSDVTGDTLFIVNSDAGEIVVFGGGAPFYLFGNNALGNGYTPGQTIRLGIDYEWDAVTSTGFLTYHAGALSSPRAAYSNLERSFFGNTSLAMYQQAGGISATPDQGTVTTFANITTGAPVPEPATMAALGLGALALLKRRRSR